ADDAADRAAVLAGIGHAQVDPVFELGNDLHLDVIAGEAAGDVGGLLMIDRQDVALLGFIDRVGDLIGIAVDVGEEVLDGVAAGIVIEHLVGDEVGIQIGDDRGGLAAEFGGVGVGGAEVGEGAVE